MLRGSFGAWPGCGAEDPRMPLIAFWNCQYMLPSSAVSQGLSHTAQSVATQGGGRGLGRDNSARSRSRAGSYAPRWQPQAPGQAELGQLWPLSMLIWVAPILGGQLGGVRVPNQLHRLSHRAVCCRGLHSRSRTPARRPASCVTQPRPRALVLYPISAPG